MRRKTPDELAWLRANAGLHCQDDTMQIFENRFGWAPSKASLATWMSDNGIKSANSPMRWTTEMDDYFRWVVPGRSEAEISDLFEARFGIRLSSPKIGNRKTHLGIKSETIGGRFEKGLTPFNKGKTWVELGMTPEKCANMLATCYKAGNEPVNGEKVPVGTERITKDGYVQVKVKRFSDKPGANNCWKMKHHIAWEDASGRSVPPSSVIVFADRDKHNFSADNLVCIPRSLWAIISHESIGYYDRESLGVAISVAKIKQAASKAKHHIKEVKHNG